jgi:hypothetical protein
MRAHRLVVAVLLLLPLAMPALADQKIKTKSNIKNDRVAASCGQDCAEAGRKWAEENQVGDVRDCDSASPEFTRGCQAALSKAKAGKSGSTKD